MINKDELMRLAVMTADEYGIKREWLFSVIKIESNWSYLATRYEPHFKYFHKPEYFANLNHVTLDTEKIQQATSWGLLQVMGCVAREFDHKGHLVELCHPQVGLKFGALKLSQLIRKYGYSTDAIAAYNAGSPVLQNGVYINQEYVNKFTKTLNGTVA